MRTRAEFFILTLGLAVSLGRAQTPPPHLAPLEPKAAAALQRSWQRHSTRDPATGARDLYEFLLTAVAHDWHPERWAEVITLGEELHDHDPASPTYGNYRWYRREPQVNDRNAVEFAMQSASLTWVLYRDRLPPAAREKLAAALALGAEGMLRHKVDVSYTNIFLMRLANCILIGESIARPDLVAQGRKWLGDWLAYTRANGIHEFNSPTYYGTDLCDLGALANYAQTPAVREQASRVLRLFWTDIALNWFEPYRGLAGARSRDYGFLTGHGYLDQFLARAGWLERNIVSEAHPALDELTFWAPPAEMRRLASPTPRRITRKWGPQPWERSAHYVGRTFTLGSSGAGYGAQDKVLALTLAGGPQLPIVAFSLEYRDDPYGQSKMGTADGHQKLTHLLPFIASVQRGPEALLVASYDPAKARNPAGGKAPIEYAHVWANFVLPATAQLFDARGPIDRSLSVALAADSPLFLRFGATAAMLMFVVTQKDDGVASPPVVVRDGANINAQRFTAVLADRTPRGRVTAAVWVRAADDIVSDESFATFRADCLRDRDRMAVASGAGRSLDVRVPGLLAPLRVAVDLEPERRLALEGGEPEMEIGILTFDGRDVGAALLNEANPTTP
jgi:hypothetical protein